MNGVVPLKKVFQEVEESISGSNSPSSFSADKLRAGDEPLAISASPIEPGSLISANPICVSSVLDSRHVAGGSAPSTGLRSNARETSSRLHGRLLLAHEHAEATVPLSHAIAGATEASILIGPEGGFDESEVKRALASGFIPSRSAPTS